MFKIPKPENVLIQIGELHKLEAPAVTYEELDLLVWNVLKGQRGSYFREDFKKLAQEKDFILIQEALMDEHMPKLWTEHFAGYQWSMAQSFQYNRNSFTTGVCIGSHLESLKTDYIRARSREMLWLTPKVSLFSEFEINGVRALFVCTHVLNFVTTHAFIRSLEEIALKISLFEGPVVLAGDFNTWNVKRYLAMKEIFHGLRLEHVRFDADQRLLRLDHVFVRGFQIQTAVVHHTISSSDHYPLELKLRLSGGS